jgi:hypothetical protein
MAAFWGDEAWKLRNGMYRRRTPKDPSLAADLDWLSDGGIVFKVTTMPIPPLTSRGLRNMETVSF